MSCSNPAGGAPRRGDAGWTGADSIEEAGEPGLAKVPLGGSAWKTEGGEESAGEADEGSAWKNDGAMGWKGGAWWAPNGAGTPMGRRPSVGPSASGNTAGWEP